MAGAGTIHVDVVFALPDRQVVLPLDVPAGTTLHDAVRCSGIVERFPGMIDPGRTPMGIFGKIEKQPRQRVLEDGDRVEIYRPLVIEPNAARKRRAQRRRAAGRGDGPQ